ncbi:uncharacterized protein LOC126380889 [Pectinophora gossypiella]|uniref:uncharacterized protein LOC126380889 n=1 Tax=Pectinophora gossypiella TaxID=13191 RepID=UPI00214E9B9A|nr:uncharacterized protein LOC126380889 [Pectinophora gossypiella]
MENSLRHRLKERRDRLAMRLDAIETECTTGILESRIKQYASELKDLADKLDTESKFYLTTSKSIDEDVIKDCMDVQLRCKDTILTLQNTPTTSYCSTKLPKLELLKFDGNMTKWFEFWDKFEANIDLKPLPEANKFSYLYGCLKGEALKAIAGLTITNDNYSVALDAIETHLRVLKTLGENIEGNHLRVTINEKFPDQVMYQVNLRVGKEPTVAQVRETLELVISAMEKSGMAGTMQELDEKITIGVTTEALHTKVQTLKSKKEPMNYIRKGTKRFSNDNDNSHSLPTKRQKRDRPCLFCDLLNHKSEDCRRVKTIKARQDKIREAGRCRKLSIKAT